MREARPRAGRRPAFVALGEPVLNGELARSAARRTTALVILRAKARALA
jgi:hypothetical protein